MKRAALLPGAAALALLLAAPPAGAYVRSRLETTGTPVQWPDPCLKLVAHTGDPPARLTPAVIETAARAAAKAWSRSMYVCTRLQIAVEVSPDAPGPTAVDSSNHVVFRKDKWCREDGSGMPCYDKSALAITAVTATRGDGAIIDADIEVNAVHFKWDDMSVPGAAPGAQDLQTVLTHEIGHLIGLDHTCVAAGGRHPTDEAGKEVPDCAGASKAIQDTIMYPSTLGVSPVRRFLSGDEIKAVCAIYPAKASTPACPGATPAVTKRDAGVDARPRPRPDAGLEGEVPVGCALGGPRSRAGLGLLGALLAAGAAAASRRRSRR